MTYFAAIDVSLEWSSLCVVDDSGGLVREATLPSEPEVLVRAFQDMALPVSRIGLEAGPLSHWI